MMARANKLLHWFIFVLWHEPVFLDLSDQLSILLLAGLPLLDGVEHLQRNGRRKFQYKVLTNTVTVLQSGEPLSTAWREYISPLFASVIQSGEQSGQLAVVLKKHVQHVEARRKWLAQILRVSAYPFLLLVMTIVLLLYVAWFVLPVFHKMYFELGYHVSEETVLITRILYKAPSILFYSFLVFLLSVVCVAWLSVQNRQTFQWIPFVKLYQLARTRTIASQLGLLLGAGLPLMHALHTLYVLKRPRWLSETANLVMEQVLGGSSVSEVFSAGWDDILPLMLHTAEKTGDLAGAFERTEVYAETLLYKRLDRFARILEPSLLLIMGGVVGLTMYAVFIPMYDFINVVSTASH
jgi:general secretion pathway protein F